MGNLSWSDRLLRIGGIILGVLGVLAFLLSMLSAVLFENEANPSFILLLFAYVIIIVSIGIVLTTGKLSKIDYNEISFQNFYLFCLLIPFSVILLFSVIIIKISQKTDMDPNVFLIVSLICWGIQILAIALWFGFQLYKINHDKISSIELMKLDYYSTLIIILLTIIWVVYDIAKIKIGFAFVMSEFMIIQLLTKGFLIKKTPNPEKSQAPIEEKDPEGRKD